MKRSQTEKLTPKQAHFARCVASGMSQAAAYREAYDVQEGSLSKTQQEAASRLMRQGKVRARVDALIRQRERGMISKTISDRERVLVKLRDFMESATPQDSAKIRAAELLGKSVGLFKDVVVQEEPQKSAEELKGELEERLRELFGDSGAFVH